MQTEKVVDAVSEPESEVARLADAIFREKYESRVRRIHAESGGGVAAPACFALLRQARREAEQHLGLPVSEPEVHPPEIWPDAFEQRFNR